MTMGLFLGGGFTPNSASIVPKDSCYPDDWVYDEDNATWSIEFSGQINASFIKTFGILWKSKVGVIFSQEYSFSNDSWGYIETSYNHGDTWTVVEVFNTSTAAVRDAFISLTTGSLWVRFTVESTGGYGYWRVWDIDKIGDSGGTAPTSCISTTEIDLYSWHATAVEIYILAYDKFCSVNEIHYLLYGEENIVYSAYTIVTCGKNGIHKLVYWAVNRCGNEEIPNILWFKIDINEPPEVKIIEPTPGIYIFGNKICTAEKIILFGEFTIKAYANDLTSGINKVKYYLDNEKIGESTKAPYECYCGYKHNGKGTLKVIAEDLAENTAETTLDIVYYNFF
jgi:hypothetical protein